EAAYLLLHALHLPLDRLEPFLDARLTHGQRGELAALFTPRLDERVPAAELLPDGLMPFVGDAQAVQSALDLCTGSGCLAILLAHAFPEADIDAVDLSADALAVAQRNVSDYGLAGRINLIRSDLFDNVPTKSYDVIICNPPYVTAVAMEELPAEYRHEPALALAGGDDGLDAVRTILRKAPQFMEHDGLLVVEIGHNRAAVEAAFPRMPFVWLATASSEASVFLLRRDEIVAGR